jgi:aspartyl protease
MYGKRKTPGFAACGLAFGWRRANAKPQAEEKMTRPSTELPACYAMVHEGLEDIAAEEIAQLLGGKVKRAGGGIVVFRVNDIDRDLLHLRTTEDVFLYGWGTDRNPASGGFDLMPDLPIVLRHQGQTVSAIALVDSGASVSVMPYSLGVQLGLDWSIQKAAITLGGTLAGVAARGIVVEASVGQLPPVRLAFAWAHSDQVPLLLGEFNFFEVFEILFTRSHRMFEIRVPGGPVMTSISSAPTTI